MGIEGWISEVKLRLFPPKKSARPQSPWPNIRNEHRVHIVCICRRWSTPFSFSLSLSPERDTPLLSCILFLDEQENVKKLAFPPADDTQVLVCGLPSVYESLCGPQSQKSLAPMSVLARLGYSQDMVYKFWEDTRVKRKRRPQVSPRHSEAQTLRRRSKDER